MYTKKIIDGYFEKTMHYGKRLKYCPYGSCGVNIHMDNVIELVSYSSSMFFYNKETDTFNFDYSQARPDYSRTTIKHINAFCGEYCPQHSYHDIKEMYYNR